jgi:UDP-N-acetylmuramyl pentapeptide synthase
VNALVAPALALVACLSPLLTCLWLFQLKEWRLDRLREHLRREGVFAAAGGRLRALIVGVALCLNLAPAVAAPGRPALLGVLALLSIGQIAANRQRWPEWTKKAALIGIVAGALALVATLFVAAAMPSALPALPVLQLIGVMAAWAMVLPLDLRLRGRVFAAARARRAALPKLRVVGIVGSVGKTTTKELVRAALGGLNPLVTPAHVNTELGLANWFLRETAGFGPHEARPVVAEMGAYHAGEIALISSVLKPSVAVVTALGSDHLALIGSEQAIVDANAEILAALPPDGAAVFLADNDASASLKGRAGSSILAGTADGADVRLTDVRETPDGLAFALEGQPGRIPFRGLHNAGNAALAIAVADALGVPRAQSLAGLEGAAGLAGTFQVREERGVRLLDDTYNISPLSFRAALAWAGSQPERPRVLLTAGLLEVGDEEERFMRELGAFARGKIERAVIVGGDGTLAFAQAFGGPVDESAASPVPPGALLLCVGRLSRATIRSLLP